MHNHISRKFLMCSPWLTLCVLLVLAWLLPNRSSASEAAVHHKAQVAQAMQSVPYFINTRWVGEDAHDQIPREAQELLRPNAIFSRSYSSLGGPTVNVLVIHCSDARDMIGHYPPVCYPSSGWVQRPSQGADATLKVHGRPMPVREYIFSRSRDRMSEDVIRIYNAFILPDGRVTRQIEDINRQSERRAVSIQGVAQLQVITLAALPEREALDVASELLSGMSNLLDALHVHKESSNANDAQSF